MSEGYRTFDHTGDLGLEVWAESPERLFELAAEALLAQIVEGVGREAEVRVELSLRGDDPRDLLVHWLNTALLQHELERAVWTRVRVRGLTPTSIDATLEGPRLDAAGGVRLREVKAVSHHFLELDLAPPRCRCRLVLDI
jgi:SHS2 domain-containing protein